MLEILFLRFCALFKSVEQKQNANEHNHKVFPLILFHFTTCTVAGQEGQFSNKKCMHKTLIYSTKREQRLVMRAEYEN